MAGTTFTIDVARSTVGFSVRHLVVAKVRGRFTRWEGTFAYDADDPARSRAEVDVDVTSVETGDPSRDAQLHAGDVFEATRFPRMTFRATEVRGARGARGRLTVTGDLTLRGVTRPVVLDVIEETRPAGPGERLRFRARTTVSRKDFGVTFGAMAETGGVAVGDRVDVEIDVEGVRTEA
jgi:polyisoprenoid-binding protein YceI